MKISYNVTSGKRKELVQAIARELVTEAKYCGAPGFAYEVGTLHIDRNGTVTGEDNRGLIADLQGLYGQIPKETEFDVEKPMVEIPDNISIPERAALGGGMNPYNTLTDEEPPFGVPMPDDEESEPADAGDGSDADDPLESDDDASCGLTISLPREGVTDVALETLKKLIANKESLIKKALDLGVLPIEVDDKVISFPWYDKMPSPEVVKATSHLLGKMLDMAKTQKRVNAKAEEPVESEKFSFRCYLLRLGFIGPEYKDVRKTLLRNLTGNGAYATGKHGTGPRPAEPLQPSEDQTEEVNGNE